MKRISIVSMGLLLAVAAGCSSSDSKSDAAASDAHGDATTDSGVTLYRLSENDNCFDVIAIAAGSDDGCDIGVADLVGKDALPVNYVMSTATVKLGTDGSIGAGQVTFNKGTLTRNSTATDPTMATCSWTQMDTADLTMIAEDTFTVAVTEVDSEYLPACTAIPTGGTCTSTWTWTMKKSAPTKTVANGCK